MAYHYSKMLDATEKLIFSLWSSKVICRTWPTASLRSAQEPCIWKLLARRMRSDKGIACLEILGTTPQSLTGCPILIRVAQDSNTNGRPPTALNYQHAKNGYSRVLGFACPSQKDSRNFCASDGRWS